MPLHRVVASRLYNHTFLQKDAQGSREIAVASALCSGDCPTRTLCPRKPLATETEGRVGEIKHSSHAPTEGGKTEERRKMGTHRDNTITSAQPRWLPHLDTMHPNHTQTRYNTGKKKLWRGCKQRLPKCAQTPTPFSAPTSKKRANFGPMIRRCAACARRSRIDSGCTAAPSEWARGTDHRNPNPIVTLRGTGFFLFLSFFLAKSWSKVGFYDISVRAARQGAAYAPFAPRYARAAATARSILSKPVNPSPIKRVFFSYRKTPLTATPTPLPAKNAPNSRR